MRSGNGRHRRPRQAPAIVVAAGVTGSAMALPLLATGSASAADAATWDRVAECESGGQWSANFGNGMYGGLQFTQDSWERNGGLTYAPSPDLASRAQQIAVAEKALAKGSTEWATCAPIAGLTNDGTSPGVDPGPASVPKAPTGPVPESNWTTGLPGTSEGSPEKAGASTDAKKATGTASPTAPATPVSPTAPVTPTTPASPSVSTDPSHPTVPTTPGAPDESLTPVTPGTPTTPGATAPGGPTDDASSATPGTGKHRGDAAPEEAGNPDSSVDSGRHASSGNKLTESPLQKSPADASKESDATDSQGKSGAYLVRPGDNLSDIAQENELPGGWTALYDANRQTVGLDPDLILPGQALDLTTGSTASAE
ncbi:transglycosylase family protein [Streptomyces sp. TX20-6-3]|uniref:transglycosylase family protein n=1 Tax=Streptomyces sp. TX20-6-3 TaxID=3028705 RepID=UPI0029A1478F|nr:transglycosylase family protein [Streptomyces sp. TX20-6-3]MDX2563756.1 transglycosylase family protein [Streptomyces sp. TX20-6-3]